MASRTFASCSKFNRDQLGRPSWPVDITASGRGSFGESLERGVQAVGSASRSRIAVARGPALDCIHEPLKPSLCQHTLPPCQQVAGISQPSARWRSNVSFRTRFAQTDARAQNMGTVGDGENRPNLLNQKVVRKGGFEPPRYCYRQPLKLVRLPVPPLPLLRG